MLDNFSEKFYGKRLTEEQHKANNIWFNEMIQKCNIANKKFYIPELNTSFDTNGDIEKYDIVVSNLVSRKVS